MPGVVVMIVALMLVVGGHWRNPSEALVSVDTYTP